MKIKSINIAQMRQQQAFEFYNRVYDKVKEIEFDPIKPFVKNLKDANDAFDIALKPLRKSLLTEKITEADERRDTAWRGLNTIVQVQLNQIYNYEKDVAKQADRILRTYGDPTKRPYTEETGIIRNLLTDLHANITESSMKNIGIYPWVQELNRANNLFADLVKERNAEQATLVSGQSKAKRQEADEAYKKLIEMINAYVLVTDDPTVFHDAIGKVNQIIDKENIVLKARRTRGGKKDEEEEPGEPEEIQNPEPAE